MGAILLIKIMWLKAAHMVKILRATKLVIMFLGELLVMLYQTDFDIPKPNLNRLEF